ncbi:hypothetical protein JCM6882_000224, partial [Rhodosporidiobolus microsporus]
MKVSLLLSALAFTGSLLAHPASSGTTGELTRRHINLDVDPPVGDVLDTVNNAADLANTAGGLDKRCDECEDGDGDDDWCPRRFHRNRFGVCVRNRGWSGCRWGYRRNRWGFCVRDVRDYDDDSDDYDRDWRGGGWRPSKGWCPKDFTPDGSGHDGFPFDPFGNGPPSWVPSGWLYYGEIIGWAPYAGWVPRTGWAPPVVFLKIVVKVVWWTPSRDWCDYYSTPGRWRWWDYKIPSHWRWSPRRGGQGGGSGG